MTRTPQIRRACSRVRARCRIASSQSGGTVTAVQRSRQQQPGEQLGVLAIALHPITRRARRLRRRDHHHIDPRGGSRPAPDRTRSAPPHSRPHRTGQAPTATPRRRSVPGPNRSRRNSPLNKSIAAACVERAWTSSPTTVIVPHHGRTLIAWGQPEPVSGQTNPREERPAYLPRQSTHQGDHAIGSRTRPRAT